MAHSGAGVGRVRSRGVVGRGELGFGVWVGYGSPPVISTFRSSLYCVILRRDNEMNARSWQYNMRWADLWRWVGVSRCRCVVAVWTRYWVMVDTYSDARRIVVEFDCRPRWSLRYSSGDPTRSDTIL